MTILDWFGYGCYDGRLDWPVTFDGVFEVFQSPTSSNVASSHNNNNNKEKNAQRERERERVRERKKKIVDDFPAIAKIYMM